MLIQAFRNESQIRMQEKHGRNKVSQEMVPCEIKKPPDRLLCQKAKNICSVLPLLLPDYFRSLYPVVRQFLSQMMPFCTGTKIFCRINRFPDNGGIPVRVTLAVSVSV